MGRLNLKTHAVIDYMLVAFLWCAPLLFFLPATTAIVSYLLGAVHLLLTMSTSFEFGIFKLIPFQIHGAIELALAIAMLLCSFYISNEDGTKASIFFLLLSAFIFLFWLLSNYRVPRRNGY